MTSPCGSRSGPPARFEDHYETALIDLINRKRAGKPITPRERLRASDVVDLMEALRRSVGQEAAPAKAGKPAKKPKKAASGQREMLMPIEGKKPAKEAAAKKPAAKPRASRPETRASNVNGLELTASRGVESAPPALPPKAPAGGKPTH